MLRRLFAATVSEAWHIDANDNSLNNNVIFNFFELLQYALLTKCMFKNKT